MFFEFYSQTLKGKGYKGRKFEDLNDSLFCKFTVQKNMHSSMTVFFLRKLLWLNSPVVTSFSVLQEKVGHGLCSFLQHRVLWCSPPFSRTDPLPSHLFPKRTISLTPNSLSIVTHIPHCLVAQKMISQQCFFT